MPGFRSARCQRSRFPLEADYVRLNPAYFDQADLRIGWLVRSGLVPCIVGSWGYYLPLMGIRKMNAALAQPRRALGRLPGGLVPWPRRRNALLFVDG
jgi:hypothetical protein